MSGRDRPDAAEPLGRRLARLCFLAALIAAPWFRGGFLPGVQTGLAVLLLAAVSFDAIFSSASRDETPVPKIWWGLLAGICLGFVQLLPLPPDTLEHLSPEAARRRAEQQLLEQTAPQPFEPARPAIPSHAVVSIAPSLTRLEVAHLLTAAAAMILAVRLTRDRSDALWLLGAIALNGTCLALVGLWVKWGGSPWPEGMIFPNGWGPFHNRNNGAGYLLLCIGATFGLFGLRNHEQAGVSPGDAASKPTGGLGGNLPLIIGVVTALALMITAILASLSRGATVALAVGLASIGLSSVKFSRLRSLAWIRAAAVAVVSISAAAGLLYAIGVLDAVTKRLATLTDVEGLLRDGRVLNWRFGWATVPEYLRFGSGLGTYRYAYRPFQDIPAEERFNYPENVFLQTLVEAGIPGMLLLTAMLGSAAVIAVRLSRSTDARSRAWGWVAVFVLSSQVVHACADNGFYRPAGFLLLAALSGGFCRAASGRAASTSGDSTSTADSHSRSSTGGRAATVLLLIGLPWAIAESASAAPAGDVLTETFGFHDDPAASPESIEELLARMESAVARRPDDGELRRRTAEIYFAMYRRHAIGEILDARPEIDQHAIWNLATPSVIYDAALRAERNGEAETLSALRTRPAVLASLVPAKRHLEFAARAAPLDAETRLYLGELHFLAGKPSDALAHFRIAADLAPGRPAMLLRIGLEAAAAGDEAFGFAALKRCWTMDPTLGSGILAVLEPKTDWSRLLEEVVPDSVPVMQEMLDAMIERGAPPDRLEAVRRRIRRLDVSASQPGGDI